MFYFVAIALAFVSLWYVFRKRISVMEDLPGPKGIPILGNALQLDMTKPHLQMYDWMNEFGDIFKLNLAGISAIVVSSQEALYELLVKKGQDFGGRPKSYRLREFCENHADVGFSDPVNSKWHVLKKLQLSQIKGYGSGFKRIEKITLDVIDDITNTFKFEDETILVDLDHAIEEMTTKITYAIIFGDKLEDEEEWTKIKEISWMIVPILEAGGKAEWLDMFPWLRFFGNSTYKELCEMRKKRRDLYVEWKDKVLKKRADGEDLSNNLMNRVFEIMEGDNPDGITEDSALMLPWQLFFGGVLTTQSTLFCFFNLVSQKQEIQDKLREESDRVLKTRCVAFEDRPAMPYHQATVLELVRYVTAIPLSVPHVTQCDTTLGTHKIPANTLVWPNLWGLHHKEDIWGDPWNFRPERYLDSSGELVLADHPARTHNLAFGAGLRVCPGETFANTRMFLIIANMIQRFHILPATTVDKQPSCHPRDMLHGVVLKPPSFKVRLRKRDVLSTSE